MDRQLRGALRRAGVKPAAAYSTGQVARILGTSAETVRRLVDAYEPEAAGGPAEAGRGPSGLMAIRIATHRRISHDALAQWLRRHDAYTRLCAAT